MLYLLQESDVVLSKGIDDGGEFLIGLWLCDGLV